MFVLDHRAPGWARLLPAAMALAALTGCAGASASNPTTTSPDTPAAEDCAWMTASSAGSGPGVVLVSDGTGSTQQRPLPAAAISALQTAQSGEGTVSLLAVDGPTGQPRWVLSGAALSVPSLADTARGSRLEDLAIGCTQAAARSATPRRPGSDILAALQAVARQERQTGGTEVVVLTDGLATGRVLNFDRLALGKVKASSVVAQLRRAGELPHWDGLRVTFAGLGDTAPEQIPGGLSQPTRDWLTTFYLQLCDASGARSCASVPAQGEPVTPLGGLPADPAPVTLEQPSVVVLGPDTVATLPGSVLFAPDSATLISGEALETALSRIARAYQSGARITVTGHTALDGTKAGRGRLSRARAQVVADALVARGVPRSAIAVAGVGATQRVAVDRRPDGSWDEDAARANRRVVITLR